MPITCPCCNSENVVVVCRVLVEYAIKGELCGEQDWVRGEVADHSREPRHAECQDCHTTLGLYMVENMLAALTHPLTGQTGAVYAPTPDENEEVCRVSLLLQTLQGSEAVALDGRVLVCDGVFTDDGTRTFIPGKGAPVSCRLDAYEHYRTTRPDLCLPEVSHE